MSHHLPYATTRCVTPPVDPEITDEDIGRWLDDERNLLFQLPKGVPGIEPDLRTSHAAILAYPDELRRIYRDAVMSDLTGKLAERVVEAMRKEAT